MHTHELSPFRCTDTNVGYASRMHPGTLSGIISGVACQELIITFSFFLREYKQGVCILNVPGYSSSRDQWSSETLSFRFSEIQVFLSQVVSVPWIHTITSIQSYSWLPRSFCFISLYMKLSYSFRDWFIKEENILIPLVLRNFMKLIRWEIYSKDSFHLLWN